MEEIDDGGPAFPFGWKQEAVPSGGLVAMRHEAEFIFPGMTLRDYFAAKVMASLCVDYEEAPPISGWTFEKLSEVAYRSADAMIAQRSK